MSGETEQQVSGWTVDTLHTHLLQLISEMDRRIGERFEAAQGKVELALVNADKAVTKAETATEKRFESVNEFRATLADQASHLVSRAEYQTKIDSINERMVDFASRLDRRDGSGTGRKDMWGWAIGGTGLVLTIMSVVALLLKFTGHTPTP